MAPTALVNGYARRSVNGHINGHAHVNRDAKARKESALNEYTETNGDISSKSFEDNAHTEVETNVHITPERCRLATMTSTGKVSETIETVKPFDDNHLLMGLEKPFAVNEQFLQAAWAHLLHIYTRSSVVSFAILLRTGEDSSIGDTMELENPDRLEGIYICQYKYPACLQHKYQPDLFTPLTIKNMEETELNTAIHFSSWDERIYKQKKANVRQSSRLDFGNVTQHLDLALCSETFSSLQDLSISYRCSKVSSKYATAIARTFRSIVTKMISNNGGLSIELDEPSPEDNSTLLSWNTKEIYTNDSCVHQNIEAAVLAAPQNQAVCAWDGSLTYDELNTLSSSFAGNLLDRGIRPGSYLPFALEKSLWAVVALLGILKAGCVFVPLDPADPTARLQEILSSTEAKAIVTSKTFEHKFESLGKQIILVPTRFEDLQQSERRSNLPLPVVQSSDPVFVLFTSGSTGRPKGIVHEHRAICSHAMAHGEAMGYKGARVLQFSAFTFDVAFIDIFTTLIFGGCVCIPSEEDRLANITDVIQSMKVNYALLTPSFASLIDPMEVPCLKTLALAGECLTQDIIQRWAGKVKIINAYGPAEVGIFMVMDVDPEETRAETIGFPLKNSSCWLVDPKNHHRLVPIGAVGELLVAGSSLALGYIKDKEKTDASFVTKPAWGDAMGLSSSRFYKTGDLCRHNIDRFDGSYDFVCRKDTQVKFHGQRIELGEIEHHLAAFPGIAVSMVALPGRGCFADSLVAVLQMCGTSSSPRISKSPIELALRDSESALNAVKTGLLQHLPRHMIPAAFLTVKNMPFLPSCKVNRSVVKDWLEGLASRPPDPFAPGSAQIATDTTLNGPTLPESNTMSIIKVKIASLKGSKKLYQPLNNQKCPLQSVGLDSIQLVSLSMFLQTSFGVKFPIHQLLDSRMTIEDLAFKIDHTNKSLMQSISPHSGSSLADRYRESNRIDILEEKRLYCTRLVAELDTSKDSTEPSRESRTSIRNLFLTGGTGYLGLRILRHILISRPELQVYILVRCSSISEGLARIIRGANQTGGWWQASYTNRTHVWPGDLTKQNFGLNKSHLQQLQGESLQKEFHIHAIIHNGARVNYNMNYDSLKPINITPTLELLELAGSSTNISRFVYVSGGQKPSMLSSDGEDQEVMKAAEIAHANGYIQTKYVSESMVKACDSHPSFKSIQLRNIRPGYIIGSLGHPEPNWTDFLWRLVAGCLDIGAYNANEAKNWLFVSDAEHVAQIIASNALSDHDESESEADGNVEVELGILEGVVFDDLWDLLKSHYSYKLEPLPQDRWLERLEQAIMAKQESHPLFPFAQNLSEEAVNLGSQDVRDGQKGSERAKAALRLNIQSCVDTGFFPTPTSENIAIS